jgi:hypothetical protein
LADGLQRCLKLRHLLWRSVPPSRAPDRQASRKDRAPELYRSRFFDRQRLANLHQGLSFGYWSCCRILWLPRRRTARLHVVLGHAPDALTKPLQAMRISSIAHRRLMGFSGPSVIGGPLSRLGSATRCPGLQKLIEGANRDKQGASKQKLPCPPSLLRSLPFTAF